jgi:hypothetical protein
VQRGCAASQGYVLRGLCLERPKAQQVQRVPRFRLDLEVTQDGVDEPLPFLRLSLSNDRERVLEAAGSVQMHCLPVLGEHVRPDVFEGLLGIGRRDDGKHGEGDARCGRHARCHGFVPKIPRHVVPSRVYW